MTLRLSGIIPAIVTPYDEDGRIAPAVIDQLVQRLIGQKVGGLYVGGTTGEGPLQTPAERVQVIDAAVQSAAGAVPVIAHIGTADTATSIELARAAADAGANAVSAVVPFYYHHQVAQIRSHFLDIAEAAPVPFLPYYLSHAAPDLHQVFAELAAHDNVIGFKFTSQNIHELSELVVTCGDQATVFNGSDEICVYGLTAGAVGAIGSTYNFMAGLFVQLANAVEQGQVNEAVKLQAKANEVIRLGAGYNPVTITRGLLQAQGLPVGPPRQPLAMLNAEEQTWADQIVADYEFL